jgi:REP element-mobilizing transposase RayT
VAIAFFSTWTTYGTWLPGDPRGWYQIGRGQREPDAHRRFEARLRMSESAVTLDLDQRHLVETTIADHCRVRGWTLHAASCRSNHVHVAVTAPRRPIEVPREQFKSWSTRRLRERERMWDAVVREHWWTDRGWDEYVDDDEALAAIIAYVREGQDRHPAP